jgi:hypothetical protein
MNDTTGQITAGSFVGDGSGLDGINSDSGSWVNGTGNVYLSTTTDKVGIGTTNPSQTFEVNGETALIHSADGSDTHNTIDRTLYIGGKNSSGSLIQAKCAIVSTPSTSHGGAGQYGRNALHFCVGPDAQNDTNASKTDSRMCIDYTGNVGIGTTSPGKKLHVYTTASESNSQLVLESADRYASMQMKDNSGGVLVQNDRGDLRLLTGYDASMANGSEAMRILGSNGNVGIGTSNPDGKLHIYESTGTSHGVGVGTLILEHGNTGGSSSIVFPSKVNITSDYAYITYNENYGEAGVSSSENGVLLLGSENDGTGSSDHVRVKTRLVVEADMTSTDPTYAFQVKSSNTTSDLFAVHRGGSIGINGNDSNVPFTIRTNKNISVDGTSYNSYCRWYRGSGNWYIGSDNSTDWNQNLYWFANINASGNPLRKVIMFENDQSKGTNLNANTFTGQHRNIVKGVNPTNIGTRVGLIVSADNNENIKVNGGVERGLDAITINETIPYVSVTTKAYDKQVFGVISGSEDTESREDKFGRVTSTFIKEEGDDRIFINSLGEGAMWISNQNGPLTSGDYVTSSHIPGYGMKQDSEFLANYTVAKITMDCDFQVIPRVKYRIKTERKTVNYYRHEESFLKESDYTKLEPDIQSDYTLEQYDENVNILDEYGQLQWEDSGETEAPYKVRYLLPDGTQISEEEYMTKALTNEEVYIAAFIGCTYHCG